MTPEQFYASQDQDTPPQELSLVLQALWYDGKDDWEQAHQLIQDEPGADAALVHAYLHRKEGDNWNADYWYRRAGSTRPQQTLQQEWHSLVSKWLAQRS